MSNSIQLDFEKPILELQQKMKELQDFSDEQNIDVSSEIKNMEQKIFDLKKDIYSNLTPWQKVQVARHPDRPYTLDYINEITTNFIELHGDRIHKDDRAIIGGFAKIDDQKVMIIGSQKGRDTKTNVECNFGCAHPEGYRKALRLMKQYYFSKTELMQEVKQTYQTTNKFAKYTSFVSLTARDVAKTRRPLQRRYMCQRTL